MTREQLLAVYDEQLRGEAEVASALTVQQHGPVHWAELDSGGFVTYRDLGGLEGDELDGLIRETVAHFRDDTTLSEFEWKTRGHDLPVDLGERLVAAGLEPEEVETVMIGEAARLAVEVALPAEVVVRRLGGPRVEADLGRMVAMQETVFGRRGFSVAHAMRSFEAGTAEFWVAEHHGEVVSAGRLTPVPGTAVAGIWGGGTLLDWRGRGIYRALVAARARSAIEQVLTHIHSDCTAMSRPILERSGLAAVTTTTPYVWRR